MVSLVPKVLKRVCQNLLVNLASLLDTMDLGRPCNQKMYSKKSLAVSGAVAVVLVGAKCTILEKVSTKTTIASCPALVLGSWVMKSMDTCSQALVGTGKGCSNPAGDCWLVLMRWHESQVLTYCRTSLFIRGQ